MGSAKLIVSGEVHDVLSAFAKEHGLKMREALEIVLRSGLQLDPSKSLCAKMLVDRKTLRAALADAEQSEREVVRARELAEYHRANHEEASRRVTKLSLELARVRAEVA